MTKSPATIVWLNYNSSGILNAVLESLKGVFDLGHPNLEVIIVERFH